MQQLYDTIYAKILILSWVHLSSNKSSSKKFSKLCSIFSTELFDYSIPELSMAYDFYFNNSVDILSFIQKSTKDLLSKIKNVSWDIFHIRYAYKTSIAVEGADVCIQYFCTYDKNLVSILKYYKLNALCININQNEVKPYFKNDIITIEYYKIYFNNIQSKQINYKYIVSKYEKLLEDL